MNDFKRYFLQPGQPISENPSPGNIAGGITTLEEKSLGAIDFDAGVVLAGASVAATGEQLLQLVLDTASGKLARNETNDEREISIWKSGVTL